MTRRITTLLLLVLLLPACATWHQRTSAYHDALLDGDFDAAARTLKKGGKKNRILYYLNKGYLEFARGDAEESNKAFESADELAEIQRRRLLDGAAALVSNPEARPYLPEDFELVMINFYKALNYLRAGDMEGALVEARAMDIKLNRLDDKYPDNSSRYQRDAFAHLLMGLLYDAAGDDNNAFIAYRNALEIYRSDYTPAFGIAPPGQLQRDLLRSALRVGFTSEAREYERDFGITPPPLEGGDEIVFFWLNGLGPVKERGDIHLVTLHHGGALFFRDEETGFTIPFVAAGAAASLTDLSTLSFAYPRYRERPPAWERARLLVDGQVYPLEIVENINDIAFKTLRDRAARELAGSLSRLAVKKSAELLARRQNAWLGLLVSLFNSATESADTRNWQTLPHSISYARVPLPPGAREITLQCISRTGLLATFPLTLPAPVTRTTRFTLFHTPR
jgi:tetratricopeptide (TPR) repeat protein